MDLSKILQEGSEKISQSLDRISSQSYRVIVKATENAAKLTLDQAIEDFRKHNMQGQLRFSNGQGFGRFIFETCMKEVTSQITVDKTVYKLEPIDKTPKQRLATASILNLPMGVDKDILMSILSKLGKVENLTIPDFSENTHKALGTVYFSRIYNPKIFTDEGGAFFKLPNRDPMVIKFAKYVIENQAYFIASEEDRIGLLEAQALRTAKRLQEKRKLKPLPPRNALQAVKPSNNPVSINQPKHVRRNSLSTTSQQTPTIPPPEFKSPEIPSVIKSLNKSGVSTPLYSSCTIPQPPSGNQTLKSPSPSKKRNQHELTDNNSPTLTRNGRSKSRTKTPRMTISQLGRRGERPVPTEPPSPESQSPTLKKTATSTQMEVEDSI